MFSLSILAAILARSVLSKDEGTPKMREVSDAIRVGAEAFIKRQYSTIAILAIVLAVVIFGVYFLTGQQGLCHLIRHLRSLSVQPVVHLPVSSECLLPSGRISARPQQPRPATARRLISRSEVVQFPVLSSRRCRFLVSRLPTTHSVQTRRSHPFIIVGFAFGASFVALFAQLGGGIYTKAADVGADLVGKVEAGIPEDDVRNPATIADLVGDNVGDCAGRGADLFESTAAENIGAMILGVALFPVFGVNGVLFPLVMCALGLLASMIGILCVRGKDGADPMDAMNLGYYITAASRLCSSTSAPCGFSGTSGSSMQVSLVSYYPSHSSG